MKTILSHVVTFILTLNCYSQVIFEKGYFITKTGDKVECLIKNLDWNNSPSQFTYKLTANSLEKTHTVNSVLEFGVHNQSKYISREVDIDRSSSSISKFTYERRPIFKRERLFLKFIIKGEASLYSYSKNNLKRFFFSLNENNPIQLIYKKYKVSSSKISTNKQYLQQLANELNCDKLSEKKLKLIKYRKQSLLNFFIKYNQCKDSNYEVFQNNRKKQDAFNLILKAGINHSSLSVNNSVNNNLDSDFGNLTGTRFGFEAEYVFPFNKNKWSIIIDPSFISFNSNVTRESNTVSGNQLISCVTYSSIEIPVGIKHSFFLNENSKIYIAGMFIVADINLDSKIEFKRKDQSNIMTPLETSSSLSPAYTIGYSYKKYNIELRYYNKNILNEFTFWNGDYKSISLTIGYNLF